jgi:hypothetical protein
MTFLLTSEYLLLVRRGWGRVLLPEQAEAAHPHELPWDGRMHSRKASL